MQLDNAVREHVAFAEIYNEKTTNKLCTIHKIFLQHQHITETQLRSTCLEVFHNGMFSKEAFIAQNTAKISNI